MELCKYSNAHDVSCFDCWTVSDFDTESEVLFFGGNSTLQIDCIYQIYNGKWTSYRCYIEAIDSILKIMNAIKIYNGTISWNGKNKMYDMIEYIVTGKPSNKSALPPYIEKLLMYHLERLPNHIEYYWTDFLEEYNWMKQIFVKRTTNMLIVSNLCNLFSNCKHIIIVMPDFFLINDEFCKSIIDDFDNILHDNINLRFQWLPETFPVGNKVIIKEHCDKFAHKVMYVKVTDAAIIITKGHRLHNNNNVNNAIKMEGWLQKKSRHIGLWRKRWTVLTSGYLSTYKNKIVNEHATETIELSTIKSITQSNDTKFVINIVNDYQLCIEFKTKRKSDVKRWINDINKYRHYCITIPIVIEYARNNKHNE
eukprot:118045_1